MAGNINAQLLHRGYGFRPDNAGLGPGAFHVKPLPGIVAQQPLGHLATRRIARTEDQYALFFHISPLAPQETNAGYGCRPRRPTASPALRPERRRPLPAPRPIPARTAQ